MFVRSQEAQVVESNQIRDILKLLSFDSMLLLDLDNTVMEAAHELGSDQWFSNLFVVLKQLQLENLIKDMIELYHAVQHHVRTKPVEPYVVKLIKSLQDIGIPVLGLTSRSHVLADTTLRQLQEIGIDLRKKIIFCDGRDKGLCLQEALLQCSTLPKHLIMVDDKKSHVDSVKKIADDLGIAYHGIRYGFLDEKIKEIDMQNAHVQLSQIKHKLPSSTHAIIEKLNLMPDKRSKILAYQDAFLIDPPKRSDKKRNMSRYAIAHASSYPNKTQDDLSIIRKSKFVFETKNNSSAKETDEPPRKKIKLSK